MKRVIALLLALVFCFSFAACGSTTQNEKEVEKADTITVTDMAGDEIEIPADTAHNTVATTYGVITPFYVTLKMSDRVLATTMKNKGFLRKVDDVIVNAGDIGNHTLDSEALAAYNPSILMIRTSDTDKKQIGERLGIPTVAVYIESADQVIEAYELIGKMFGCEDRAKELITWINNELDTIKTLASTIPEDEKVTAVCMGSTLGQIAAENMLQVMMIETAGGKSEVTEIADDLMWVDVGVEAVFDKDPEFIFVSSSNPVEYSVEELYEESAWSGMKAIQNRHVFLIPAKLDSWDMPGPAFVLGIYYMMHCMYPNLVTSEMMQEKIDEFYGLFYGKTFTGEELKYEF